jgi:putative DNA primase/helicase
MRSTHFNPRSYTKKIIDHFGNNIFYAGRFPHGYLYGYVGKDKVWRQVDAEVEKLLRCNLSDRRLSNHTVREIMGDLCQYRYRPMPEEPPWNLVNFRNGIWDVKKGNFVQLGEDDDPPFFLSQIPHEIDPENTTVDRINSLFIDWVGPDYVILLYELSGYSLLRCNTAQKFFNLFGGGDNGKTTYSQLLRRIVGEANISSLSIDDMMGDRFSLATLMGKLVNITGELMPTLRRTDKIKLLTGGDSIHAQEKFKSPFSFIPYTKLVFMGNVVPSTPDSSSAFYRRTLVLKFPNVIPPEKRDPLLLDSIREEEIKGLVGHILLNVLPPFIERKFRFSVDPSVDELRDQWEVLSNPLKEFFEEYFLPSPGAKEFIPNFVLGKLYHGYCEKHGLRPLRAREFADLMQKEGHNPSDNPRRLLYEEIETFKEMGFDALAQSKLYRGWFCYNVTLVTAKIPNDCSEYNLIKETAVTSVTV